MPKSKVEEIPVIWLQTATCTGCSVSVLNVVSPSIKNVIVDEVIPGKHINIRYHATIMAGQGDQAIAEMENTAATKKGGYVLVIEGAIPTIFDGNYGYLGEHKGKPVPMTEWVNILSENALAVIALGTCAAFGGIAAGKPNPSNSVGVMEYFQQKNIKKPLVNIPGCPPHPDWFVGTVASILLNGLPATDDLDVLLRPRAFYGKLVHENCPRRAYFDEGKFARNFNEEGCLNELGCKGPVTHADCPIRLWNHGANWCIGANSPCIGCCEPGFPDLLSPMYKKLTCTALPNVAEKS